mgnify:CR=1 FL=1
MRLVHIGAHLLKTSDMVDHCLQDCKELENSNPTKEEIAWLCKYWNLTGEIGDALKTLDKSLP